MFLRYVALGDSLTCGTGDLRSDGSLHGFADRLAQLLAVHSPDIRYANLARTSVRTAEVQQRQVDEALALGPDVVTAICGVNDIIRLRLRPREVAVALDGLFGDLRAGLPDAEIVTATLPDLTGVSVGTRPARGRVRTVNRLTRAAAARHGVRVLRLDELEITRAELAIDGIHPSARGHARIAVELASLLGVTARVRWPDADPAGGGEVDPWTRMVRTAAAAPAFLAKRRDRARRIVDQPAKRPDLVRVQQPPAAQPRRRMVSEPA